jgi:Cd2+/Zn2+-exporting ATPase
VLLLEYDRETDPRSRAVGVVHGAGHTAVPLEGGRPVRTAAAPSWLALYRSEVIVAASGALIVVAWLLGLAGAVTASAAVYALAIIVGGTITWRRAAMALAARTLDMNVLMTIAVTGAAAIGEWGEAAMVMFLFALGGMLESRSLARTRRSIRTLMDLAPAEARVRRGTGTSLVPPDEVQIGETIVVRPGERLPLDGELVSGSSAFDESPITGESVPVDKAQGDEVFAGTLNTTGLVEVRVTALASDTTLARIVHLVESAQSSRAPVQRFVDRFSRVYTPAVIALAGIVAFVLPALGSAGAPWPGFEQWHDWVYRALVLLVVSCPCALVVSTPVAVVSAITRATRDGVLVKGGAFLELAGKVRAVAFDKTGTLTEGRPTVAEVVTLGTEKPNELLSLAAALESHSNHPLARAVVRAAADTPWLPEVRNLVEAPGRGVHAVVEDITYAVGSLVYAEERGVLSAEAAAEVGRLEDAGLTVLAITRGPSGSSEAVGLIGLADAIRDDAPAAVSGLRSIGVEHVAMFTGDNERTAAHIAQSAGISDWRARLLPEDKTAAILGVREEYGIVAMVGDGINDAPALAAADIGIAMGAAGSDTAIETADVALMSDDLGAVSRFLVLGRRTMAIIWQNVALSIGIKAVVLLLTLGGVASLWLAVFADTGVALIVIANGLRLLRSR